MTQLWHAEHPSRFIWRQWEGDIVVYVRASGDTHELGHEASAVLAAMLANPERAAPAATWLSELLMNVDGSPALQLHDRDLRAFESMLNGLQRLGVVAQSRP